MLGIDIDAIKAAVAAWTGAGQAAAEAKTAADQAATDAANALAQVAGLQAQVSQNTQDIAELVQLLEGKG